MKASNPKVGCPSITLALGETALLSRLEIQNKDILLGKRDHEIRMHPGTVAFRIFISTRVAQYKSVNSRAQRINAVALATKSILDSGTRILKPAQGPNIDASRNLWWVAVDERSCCEKVGMAIRDYIKAKIRDERTVGSTREEQEPFLQEGIHELPSFAQILQRVIGGVHQRDGVVNRVLRQHVTADNAQKSLNPKPVSHTMKRTTTPLNTSKKSSPIPFCQHPINPSKTTNSSSRLPPHRSSNSIGIVAARKFATYNSITKATTTHGKTSTNSETSRRPCSTTKLSHPQQDLTSPQLNNYSSFSKTIHKMRKKNAKDKSCLNAVLLPHQVSIDIFVPSNDLDKKPKADPPISFALAAEGQQLQEAHIPKHVNGQRLTISHPSLYGAPTGGFSYLDSLQLDPTSLVALQESVFLSHGGRNLSPPALDQRDLLIPLRARKCLVIQASSLLLGEQTARTSNLLRREAVLQDEHIADHHNSSNPPVPRLSSNDPSSDLDSILAAPLEK